MAAAEAAAKAAAEAAVEAVVVASAAEAEAEAAAQAAAEAAAEAAAAEAAVKAAAVAVAASAPAAAKAGATKAKGVPESRSRSSVLDEARAQLESERARRRRCEAALESLRRSTALAARALIVAGSESDSEDE